MVSAAPKRRALDGVRILDLSQVAIGPYATLLLAGLGAQVIKVESDRRADTSRGAVQPTTQSQMNQYPRGDPGERPWNRAALFNHRNRGKLGITLDFTTPRGKDLLLRLVSVSDALVENFRASVLERQGLDWETIRGQNPRIVYLKLSSQGATGPERDYGSLGSTLEQTAGIASITGYTDGIPLLTNETYPDPVAGILGAGALIGGLRRVRQTGRGQFIDLSQREATVGLLGEAMMDFALNRRVAGPLGNRHPSMAPHGVYPCKPALTPDPSPAERERGAQANLDPQRIGRSDWASDQADTQSQTRLPSPAPAGEGSGVRAGSWIAIAIETDGQWQSLRSTMGDPEWSRDPRFDTVAGRWRHQDEIDAKLAEWTACSDHHELTHRLQAHGVPAGAVLDGVEVLADPQLVARGWWEPVTPPEIGEPFPMITPPWRMSGSPYQPLPPAPRLGEYNEFVYREILGLSAEELEADREAGVTSTEPRW
jgi:crotonobetainyl-CoA:carnitine CoA-transferase CaiB-like acyl-CoA transferase